MNKDATARPDTGAGSKAGRGKPRDEGAAGSGTPHPLDQWLRRELEGLYPSDPADALPPQMAELAERLKTALEGAGRSEKKEGSD